MPAVWTDPRTWKFKDIASAAQMNTELRDNLLFLKQKPRYYANAIGAADFTVSISNSVWTAIDDTKLAVTLQTSVANEEVFIYCAMGSTCPVVSGYRLDVLIDGAIYASSMSGTPNTSGVFADTFVTINVTKASYFRKRVVIATPGVHTFVPRMILSASTQTVTFKANGADIILGAQVE